MSAKKLHILLADDETEIASLVASVLERSGHTVEIVGDGQAAMDLLKENPARYKYFITDSNMPVLSGIKVIEYLRETGFPGKIILLSGYVEEESDDVYQALNIDSIIQKPFTFAVLTKAVKDLGVV